jgi:hypothetical protein
MSIEHSEKHSGIIFASDFNIEHVPPDASLFFDDYKVNTLDVQEHVNANRLKLHSVHCPPKPIPTALPIILYKDGTQIVLEEDNQMKLLKLLDKSFSKSFKFFIKKQKMEVGPGLTPGMIHQIIEYENSPIARAHNRVYFFDFDMLLSQFSGLDFSFLSIKDTHDSLLHQYAKYLFSDHIGAEPPGGRLTLLQTMFRTIGPDRIYIVTSNPFANKEIIYKNGNMTLNPYLSYFIAILQILLPNFEPSHLVCANSKNQPPLYNKKSSVIVDILNQRAIAKPPSTRPSAIAKPPSTVRRSTRLGGSKRRMRVRCTRRKRRIT